MPTPAKGIHEVIARALRGDDLPAEGTQPAILMNNEIDHTKVEKYATCYVNAAELDLLNTWLAEGYIVFRMQSELSFNGHNTMAYLAKMKAN